MKNLIILILVLLAGCIPLSFVKANNNLTIEADECNFQYGGDSCESKIHINNSTGKILTNGQAIIHIDYNDSNFDGIGIEVLYNNVSSSNWINGSLIFDGFDINTGETLSSIDIITAPNLYPGTYDFSLELKGDEYTTPPVDVGGNGGGSSYYIPPVKTIEPVDPINIDKGILDGDIIRNPNTEGIAQFDIYIVKIIGDKKFRRLILSPTVFESYDHLRWEDVKLVSQDTMNLYTISNLVRCINDYKVYQLFPSGDTGSKRHLDMSAAEFERQGYDWDSVYIINKTDRDSYVSEN